MKSHGARLGTLLAVAIFLGCPPATPRAGEGTSGGGTAPGAAENVGFTPFDRASAVNIGVIVTQNVAVGGCVAFITATMEVELDKNNSQTGGTAWLVQNQCNNELVVTVSDFKLNNVPVDAPVKCKGFPKDSGDYATKVAVGEVGVITCRVKPGNDGEYRYKYSVRFDNKVIDPDIIIKRR